MKKSLLLFFILISFAIAQEEISEKVIKPNIYGSIGISKVEPLSSPYVIDVLMNVSNPTDSNLTLHIYEKFDNRWKKIGEIGQIGPNENRSYNLTFRFEYNGASEWENEYYVIGIEKLYGFKFRLSEDWRAYESQMKDYIFYLGIAIVPALFLILSFVLFVSANAASKRRAYGIYPKEYTFESLFRIPRDASPPVKALLLLSNPILWLFIALIVIGAFTSLTIGKYKEVNFEIVSLIMFSILSAAALPIIFAIMTWYADFYEREPLRFVAAMFVWGIIAAGISYALNTAFASLFSVQSEIFMMVFFGILISPVIEEIVKSVGILLFSAHHQFDDTLDGLLYGFCIGCGFAFIENLFYFTMKYSIFEIGFESWLYLIIYRSFFNTLTHGFLTGFLGAFLGFFKFRMEKFTLSYFPALFLVMILHMLFNFTAIYDAIAIGTYRVSTFIFNPALVAILGIGFVAIYIFGLRETKGRIPALSNLQ
jgi:RsiW-degrading membrane proteinase PrsW (M82 family)